MRLWHETLIPHLPRAQLLGQHRECAALRGAGWGRPHATVNYVFRYPRSLLYRYHLLVMKEMQKRSYRPDAQWLAPEYRGKSLPPEPPETVATQSSPVYPEHDDAYLAECLQNLKNKGIEIDINHTDSIPAV